MTLEEFKAVLESEYEKREEFWSRGTAPDQRDLCMYSSLCSQLEHTIRTVDIYKNGFHLDWKDLTFKRPWE